MRICVLLLSGLGLVAQPPAADAQHRELGAHEHGRGTLNIAIEGLRLSMDLDVPGADIVGFEHSATTPQQTAAVDKAKTQLSAPQDLFQLPASAGCVLEEAKVAIESGEHGHATKTGPPDHVGQGHSDFNVQYTFNCKAPAAITTIEFGYFRIFGGAQRLDVNVTTPKQQTKFEVTRAKPQINLAGMM